VTFYILPPLTPFGLMTFFLAIRAKGKTLCVIVFAPFVVLNYESILFVMKVKHLHPYDLLSLIFTFLVLVRHVSRL